MKTIFTILLLSTFIYSQVSVVVNDFQVSDNKDQFVYRPSVAVAHDGSFAVSWGDERNGENGAGGTGRIYSSIFDKTGTPLTPNFWSDGAQYGNAYDKFSLYANSSIFLPNGTLIVAWHVDARSSVVWGGIKSDDVCYSAFNMSGQKIIEEKQLNRKDNLGSGYAWNPTAVFMPPSSFLVAFEYSLNEVKHIGCTLVDANSGELLGETTILNDNEQNGRISPSASSNGNHTIITWTDGRSDAQGDIYLQRIAGTAFSGANIKVNSNSSGYNQFSRVAMDDQGNFVIVWIDARDNGAGDLFAQKYDSDGKSVGDNFKLTSSNSFFFEYPPAVALNNNGIFAVAWTDSVPGKNVSCKTRFFNFSTGEPVTSILEVTNTPNTPCAQVDLKCGSNGNFYYSWLDSRGGDKGGIYAKILSSTTTDVKSNDLPIDFNLAQNYPNPFNPSTKISFSLPEKAHVSLKVFDILGKEIADLISEERNAGNYEVDYNAENLANGIYVYQLKAGKNFQSKKMMLLK